MPQMTAFHPKPLFQGTAPQPCRDGRGRPGNCRRNRSVSAAHRRGKGGRRCRTRLSPTPRRAATGQSREPAWTVSTVATLGMFEGAGITDTMTRRLSIPVPKAPACITRMAEGGTPLRISSRRTTSARSAAVSGVSPASLSLLAWIITIVPLPAFRAAPATTSAATGDNSELLGRKNTAALGQPGLLVQGLQSDGRQRGCCRIGW